jgi:hypothetical protein
MALIRKTFGAGFEQMKLVVKVCDENFQLRQNLLSLLNLPFANREKLLDQWLKSLKAQNVAESLLKALELLKNDDMAELLLKELSDKNG